MARSIHGQHLEPGIPSAASPASLKIRDDLTDVPRAQLVVAGDERIALLGPAAGARPAA